MSQRLHVTPRTEVLVVGDDNGVTVRLSDRSEVELRGDAMDLLRLIIEADRQMVRLVDPGRSPGRCAS